MPLPSNIRPFVPRGFLHPLVSVLAAGWAMAAVAAPLPFSVAPREAGEWVARAMNETVTGDLHLDALINHVGAPDRFVVLSAPGTNDGAKSLRDFAERVPRLFTDFRSTTAGAPVKARRIGHSGLDLRFELSRERQVVNCELFVFNDAGRRWAVLYARPAPTPAASTPVFAVLQPRVPLPPGVVAMAPYRVKNDPLTTFPISLNIRADPRTGRIAAIVVTDVPPDSVTERAGVKVGDAVIAINGRKTVDFPDGVNKSSELGRILLNRQPGDEVNLEIKPVGGGKPFGVTLRVPDFWDHDDPFGHFSRRR